MTFVCASSFLGGQGVEIGQIERIHRIPIELGFTRNLKTSGGRTLIFREILWLGFSRVGKESDKRHIG